MLEYSCEFSPSCDEAHKRLTQAGCKHEVLSETSIGFRKKPTRKAKEILKACGFMQEPEDDAPLEEKLAALKERFS